MTDYDKISGIYDKVNSDVDYAGYAAAIDEKLKASGVPAGSLVLDLGCGTGKMTRELRALGYDMIGVDVSEGMLAQAKNNGDDGILYLCQDMTEFELYGTVAAVVCTLDGINHLTEKVDVIKCFSLVHNYLDTDGLFIFDVNTEHKFETVYGERDYVIEEDGYVLTWQNAYDKDTGICDFFFSLFEENDGGMYSRTDTEWSERYYTGAELTDMLETVGFSDIQITDNGERMFVCGKK